MQGTPSRVSELFACRVFAFSQSIIFWSSVSGPAFRLVELRQIALLQHIDQTTTTSFVFTTSLERRSSLQEERCRKAPGGTARLARKRLSDPLASREPNERRRLAQTRQWIQRAQRRYEMHHCSLDNSTIDLGRKAQAGSSGAVDQKTAAGANRRPSLGPECRRC